MDQRQALSAAGVPVELGGRQLYFSPFTDKDIAELDMWVRGEYIKMVRASFDDSTTKNEREEALALAMKHAAGLTWLSGEGAKLIGTVAGMARLAYQSVRKRHADVTLEWLQAEMFNPENVHAVRIAFEQANVTAPEQPGSKKGASLGQRNSKQQRRKRKRTERSRKGSGGRRRK